MTVFSATPPVRLPASRYSLICPKKTLNFFFSIRLRTLGSRIFAISFLFNYLRTLEGKIPGVGAGIRRPLPKTELPTFTNSTIAVH